MHSATDGPGRLAARVARAVVLPVTLIALWGYAFRQGLIPSGILASPSDTIEALRRLAASGALLENTFASAGHLLEGLTIGVSAGLLTASACGLSRQFAEFVQPTLSFLGPIPVLAWIPILIVFWGIDGARVALIAIGTAFAVYAATATAIADTPAEYLEVAKLCRKGPLATLFLIVLPSGAWTILGGIRLALGMSWILLLASEVIASSSGIGWLIWDARNFGRGDEMLAGMVWVGLLGYLSDRALMALQAWVTRWRPSFAGY